MTVRTPTARWLRGRTPIPYFVLLAGLLATLAGALYAAEAARNKDEIRFESAAQHVTSTITTKAETYLALLRAGVAYFAASEDVTLHEFREFVSDIDIRTRYPGIQGIGFAKRARPEELPRLVQSMREQGMTDFSVWPAYPRQDYFPIIYLEPLDRRNQAAIGYDMFTDPARHSAMERAARTGRASASGKVTLKQEIDPEKQSGFLIYMPVYRGHSSPKTDDERFEALQGFVYSPFRAGDFLGAVLATEGIPEMHVAVYDGTSASESAALFDNGRSAGHSNHAYSARFRSSMQVYVAGRPWLVTLSSAEGFEESSERRFLPWILLIGTGVSTILFTLTRREVEARTAAEQAAAELRRSEEALRGSDAELRRVVQAERQAHEEAASANRAKDDFLATLSHELRTPLNAILGWATMLKGGRLTADQQARALDVIVRNARVQAQLIEDLLDISRIITGKLRIEIHPANVATPIRAALDTLRPAAEAKQVVLESHLMTSGPVLGDAHRLQQVAWNLLSNAIKFTPPGGRVVASLEQKKSHVVFTVRDTGIGIDREFLPHVFERFRQHDSSTTRAHGGMGLGLAIVRHLVGLHGGSIRAESDGHGSGSAFIVELPLRTVQTQPEVKPASDDRRVSSSDLSGVNALVVDDERDSRDLAASILAQAGATVFTASSAPEALELLVSERVQVMLADISMPETDGYTLMRQVRAHASEEVRRVRSVAVTAHARQEDRQLAEEAGFDRHIAKPIETAGLRDAVYELAAEYGKEMGT